MRLLVVLGVMACVAASSRGEAAEARLLLRGHVNVSGSFPVYSEDSVNFYGTHVYLLESALMRHRAEEALGHPAPADLKIIAERVPNTSVILVTATSADQPAAASLLGALIDEFLKFKREQRKRTFADAIGRVDAALKGASREAAPELQNLREQLTAASVFDSDGEFEKLPDK
jgi:hypothetical protein